MTRTRRIHWLGKTTLRRRAIWLGAFVFAAVVSGAGWLSFADDKTKPTEKPAQVKPAKTEPAKSADAAKTPADKNDKKLGSAIKPAANKPSSDAATEPLSSQREAAAVGFAKQHHPELAVLLGRLKDSHPEQFTKAIRELDRTREKLEKQRDWDADRYAIMLHEWQLDSRVRLLAARMTMSTSAELETELRQTLLERHDTRLQLLTYDREKSKTRLQKMDEQITDNIQNRQTNVDRELDKIKKSADVRKRNLSKPAAKRPADK